MAEGGVERLMFIVRSPAGNYGDKVVRFATQVNQLSLSYLYCLCCSLSSTVSTHCTYPWRDG